MTPAGGWQKKGKGKEKGKGKRKAMFGNKPIILTDWCGGCCLRIVEL
jgi:hypothetical protein